MVNHSLDRNYFHGFSKLPSNCSEKNSFESFPQKRQNSAQSINICENVYSVFAGNWNNSHLMHSQPLNYIIMLVSHKYLIAKVYHRNCEQNCTFVTFAMKMGCALLQACAASKHTAKYIQTREEIHQSWVTIFSFRLIFIEIYYTATATLWTNWSEIQGENRRRKKIGQKKRRRGKRIRREQKAYSKYNIGKWNARRTGEPRVKRHTIDHRDPWGAANVYKT